MEYRAEEYASAPRWGAGDSDPVLAEATPDGSPGDRLWPALAGAVALFWVAGALWLVRETLPRMDAAALVQFVGALLSVPLGLGVLWLLAQRNSRAEAGRFGRTAHGLRSEAAALERSVAALSVTIDGNRRQLAEQVEALVALGDAAGARLTALRQDVGAEVARVDEHARSLAGAAEAAGTRIAGLLADLPRAEAQVEEVARLLERTGTQARDGAAALDLQLHALAERGELAEQRSTRAADALARHAANAEASGTDATALLEAASARASALVGDLLHRTGSAMDEAQERLAAQGDHGAALLARHRAALDTATRDSAEALASRLDEVEDVVDRVAARLDAQRASGDLIVDQLRTGLAGVEGQLETLHTRGAERAQTLAASIGALGGSANAMTEALAAGDAMATRTIGTTEALLIALDSATREIDETLPDALRRLDARVAGTKGAIAETKPELLALVTAAESTHDAVEAIAGVIADQRRTLEQLSASLADTLSSGRSRADALGHTVEDAIERTRTFADEAAPQLTAALLRVRDTAQHAADEARQTLAGVVPDAVAKLEHAGTAALRRAAAGTVERQVRALADATETAVAAAARAAEQVAERTRELAGQTAAVEQQIALARTERETADRDTLARRSAELIEALHTASIDVAKLLAPDVADTAWAAYLKGDRGVFTRRAVRLVDAVDAGEIARLHDTDARFRDTVNRYIHDFEAMLRAILVQSNGQPLSITLLSSDMGKLYVALAQAIDRLR